MIVTAAGGGPPDGIDPLTAPLAMPRSLAVDGTGAVFFSSGDTVFEIGSDHKLRRIAGTGFPGFAGDGGPAAQAQLALDSLPAGAGALALDGAAHLFIADVGNGRVRRVDLTSGIIVTIAGNGSVGFSGDGGPATTAQFNAPSAVVADAIGNFFVADRSNNRVRRILPTGTITTFAGSGCFRHDNVMCAPPKVVNGVYQVGDGGPATAAIVYQPLALALDGTDVYIVDYSGLRRVRQGVISSVVANGAPCTVSGVPSPMMITGAIVLGGGDFLLLDSAGNRVCYLDASGHTEAIAGNGSAGFSGDGGSAAAAQLASPSGMALDLTGNLYIADAGNARLRRVANAAGAPVGQQMITTFAGSGAINFYQGATGPDSVLASPAGVKLDGNGNLYIADPGAGLVRRLDAASGIVSTVAGLPVCAGACSPQLMALFSTPATSMAMRPIDVAVDGNGAILVADAQANRVWRVALAGGALTVFAGTGQSGSAGDGGPATSASFQVLGGVAEDAVGNVYISDSGANVIRRVDRATGIITSVAGDGVAGFAGDQGPALAAQLNQPAGLVVDTTGAIYVADTRNDRVRRIYPDPNHRGQWLIDTVAGGCGGGDCSLVFNGGDGLPATSAMLASPAAAAVDAAGNLFIADRKNERVRRVDAKSGLISSFAGSGCFSGTTACVGSLAGDGGAADAANLNEPAGVAVGADGSVFIADSLNRRVRRADVARCTVTPSAVIFPPLILGSHATQSVTLENAGRLRMSLGPIDVTGFPYSTTCGTSLGPGANCAIVLSFSAVSVGQYSGAVVIHEGDDADQVTVTAQVYDMSLSLNRPSRPQRGPAISAGKERADSSQFVAAPVRLKGAVAPIVVVPSPVDPAPECEPGEEKPKDGESQPDDKRAVSKNDTCAGKRVE